MKKDVIFHIDINNAFLSWTAVKLLNEGYERDIREIPSVIGGDEDKRHGIVLAKSPVAKKYKIQTAESLYSARQKCKELEVFPPDMDYYHEMSSKFLKHLEKYSPKVEKLSVDECFMDMSNTELLYDDLVLLAYKIKDEIYSTYGFTVNIGIANSKICAKMASDFEKPNKVHTLFDYEIERKMWPLPVDDLFMVGKQTAKVLHELGINTIGELANKSEEYLTKHFNKQGTMLLEYANGKSDDSFFTRSEEKNVSMSTSETLSTDIVEKKELIKILYKQVDNLSKDLRKQKLFTSTITINYKTKDFDTYSKQMTLPYPSSSSEEISKYMINLLDQSWNNEPIRNLGIRFSNLTDKRKKQISIFSEEKEEKTDIVQNTLDKINDKYGDSVIRQANLFTKN